MSDKSRPTILVVDDDPSVLTLTEIILTRAGLEAITVENATKAAQVLKGKLLPDVMVLDMMLPDVSGLDFLKQVRAKSNFDDLPILILSALADPEQIRAALDAGADRYLTKPYLSNNLLPTVQELLRSGRVRRK